MPKYVVRHGVMRDLGVFASRGSDLFARGTQVIARTARGLEVGEVLCEANELALANLQDPKNGQILRERDANDAGELRRLMEQQKHEHATCQRHIEELKLDMKLVDVERIYGGERVVVYYLAEDRISNPHRDETNRRAGRSETAGRLWRLRQTGLLQHPSVGDAPRFDADGEAAKGDARPQQDFRPVRAAEVLFAL